MMTEPLQLAPGTQARVGAEPYQPPVTEDAVALLFVAKHGGSVPVRPQLGLDALPGTHWGGDAGLRHFDDIRKLCRLIGLDSFCEKQDAKRLGRSQTVAGVAQLARADPRLAAHSDVFDADRHLLNTPAGIVDLRDATVRPHAGDYLTKLTAYAPAFGVEPMTWLRFLDDVCRGDGEIVAFLRRLLGYALTGETREQVVVIFHGDGANGKSTLLEVFMVVAGSYAIKVPSSTLMAQRGDRHPTDVAQLLGVRLAVANEVSEGEHWDEARVKELSGDTKLTARFMRQDFFQFEATHKFVIAANHRPQMRSMDHAMRRRLVLVPFEARFEGDRRDPDILRKLTAEAGAILAWMIGGAVEWYERGLEVPERVRAASEEYLHAMDSLGLWIEECCDLADDLLTTETSTRLYRSDSSWKDRRGEHPVSQMRWSEQLQARGIQRYRSGGIRYRGIRLTQEESVRIAAALSPRE